MNNTISTSSLMDFKECQKLYYFEDALKLKSKKDPFFSFSLEVFDLVKAAVAIKDSAPVHEIFKKVSPEWFVLAKEMEERVGFLQAAVTRYLNFELSRKVDIVEDNVLFNFTREVNDKEYTFSGRVDRIIKTADGYEAIKYKLGSPVLTSAARTPQNKPENCLELALCYTALKEKYPGIKISYYHLRNKDDRSLEPVPVFNNKPNKNIVTATFTDEICEGTLQQLNELELDKMLELCDISTYSCGDDCSNCEYRMLHDNPINAVKTVEKVVKKPKAKSKLNSKQAEAANSLYGSIRILAPAGSGKTYAIMVRFTKLIESGVSHKNILVMTFTNKAAEELRERISAATGIDKSELEIYTYNSFCFNVVKRYKAFLGMDKISMIKKCDRYNFIRECLEANPFEGVSYSNPYNPNYGIIAEIDKTTSTIIDKNMQSKSVEEVMTALKNSKKEYIEYCIKVATYIQKKMLDLGMINYSDQINLVNKLFDMNPNISKVLSFQYKFLMLDEYQDTDNEQSKFIYSIAKHHNNICIVGDDDQSIYGWRKADIKNILLFHENFPHTKDIIFEKNYRSSRSIVNLAEHIIKGNKVRMNKNIVSASKVADKLPTYTTVDDYPKLLPHVESLLKDYQPGDIAIISRKNSSLVKFETLLSTNSIPARFQVSYLKDHPSFSKIYNLLQIVFEFDPEDDIALYKALNDLYGYAPTASVKSNLSLYQYLEFTKNQYFDDLFNNQLPLIKEYSNKAVDEVLYTLENILEIGESDAVINYLLEMAKEEDYSTIQQVYDRLKEIVKYEEDINIDAEEVNCINLITAHGSKGREYPVVILLDINEFAMDNEQDEEARRVLYVALTRAKQELHIFEKANKKAQSPFATEIQEYLSNRISAAS